MRIAKNKLKKIIREAITKRQSLHESFLYVTNTPYGVSIQTDKDEYFTIGEMILELLKVGDDDFFQANQGVDPKSLERLLKKHEEGVQGGLHRWDNDVFPQYYNVDTDRVLRLYARLKNLTIREIPYLD